MVKVGTQLGSLEITSLLGRGGMGEVYRATDKKLKREVAIKILPGEFSNDADRLNRFQREAEVLASLNHPNIAGIYDVQEANETRFLVLELVEGDTLADRIRRGPIPADEILEIAKSIAEALEAAHEKGVVHRDLKPANIKITPAGQVKVLDFGLAKVFERNGTPDLSNSPTMLSASVPGVIIGTAGYMSPEQAKGAQTDQRTDLFSLGSVLYEMLTGRQAFGGETVSEILASVLKSEPDPSPLPANLNPRIRELLGRCLEKNPKNRWQAAGDIRVELQSIEDAPVTEEKPSRSQPLWKSAVLVAIGLMLSAAIGGLAVWKWRQSVSLAVTRFSLSFLDVQEANFTSPIMAISRDGTQIVYQANRQLYLRSVSDFDAKPVAGTLDTIAATSPAFSPDGRSIVYWAVADGSLKTIPVSGGVAVPVAKADDPLGIFGLDWSDRGILFGLGYKTIQQVSEKGGEPAILLKAEPGQRIGYPRLLPGGSDLLFLLADETRSRIQIAVQSLDSGKRKVLFEPKFPSRGVKYVASSSHILFFQDGALLAVPLDLKRLEVIGNPVPVVQGVRQALNASPIFDISDTGSLIYVPGPVSNTAGEFDIGMSTRDGILEHLNLPPRSYNTPRVSPDGKRVAVGIDEGNDANIWIYDLSGANAPNRLTFGGKNRFPIWSPDGQRIAFQSDRESDLAIFSQRADGAGAAERLTKPEKDVAHAPESWSPDGNTILFRSTQGTTVSLWSFSLKEKTAAAFGGVQSIVATNAAFSPDGRWVAYQAEGDGKNITEVYVQPFPATGARYQLPVSRDNHGPIWSRDGKELFYTPGPGEFAVVGVTTSPAFAFGNPKPVRQVIENYPPSVPRQYDITPGGKLLGRVLPGQGQAGRPIVPQINVVLNWAEELKQRVPVR
jgi:serine/threonine-protein kinase